MTPIGFSIQKGLPASIAARAISWCKKLGGDGDRVNLGIREQVTVVFVHAIKPEDVEGIFACVGGRVSGRDEAGCDQGRGNAS